MSAKSRKTNNFQPLAEDASAQVREYSVCELEYAMFLCAREIVRHADEHFAILERLENEIQARERKDPLSKARKIVERYGAGRA